MKIIKAETFVLSQKLDNGQAFAYSQAWYNTRTILLLKLTTDDGIAGWGEAFGPAFVNKTLLDTYFSPLLINMDPLDINVIWECLYNKFRDHCTKGFAQEAISAVDIALWDIKGKALNLPIYKLLGGAFRKNVVPYATGLYRTTIPAAAGELGKEAQGYVDKGFLAMKMKIGFGIEQDIAAVREVRIAVGDKMTLMVDANHAYNASAAIQLGRKLEEYNIAWFEEPVPPEDIDGYVEVKSRINIPVSGGEAEFTRYGFSELLERRAVDIVQPDCCVTGGISEVMRVAVLSAAHNIQCIPHIWGSAIALYAGLHVAFSLPDYPASLTPSPMYLEYDRTPNIFREKLAFAPLKVENGFVSPPAAPGLGIEIDENLIKQYSI